MINPTCASCKHAIPDGRRIARVCRFDRMPAPDGQACRINRYVVKSSRLPFSDRLLRSAHPQISIELL